MKNIVLLIPCYNEQATIGDVIKEFNDAVKKEQGFSIKTYVYDNNCTDGTAKIASDLGATIVKSEIQGKGAVVKHMFKDVVSGNIDKADYYAMVDGDMTYPAKYIIDMAKALDSGYDMVIGDRLSANYHKTNNRKFHSFGNTLVKFLVNLLFKGNVTDIMTGYRVFSYNYILKLANEIISDGFQIETELTIRTLKHRLKIYSLPIEYRERPEGSVSKLNTIKDGFRVICMIIKLRIK